MQLMNEISRLALLPARFQGACTSSLEFGVRTQEADTRQIGCQRQHQPLMNADLSPHFHTAPSCSQNIFRIATSRDLSAWKVFQSFRMIERRKFRRNILPSGSYVLAEGCVNTRLACDVADQPTETFDRWRRNFGARWTL
jgi:hypothetical protein